MHDEFRLAKHEMRGAVHYRSVFGVALWTVHRCDFVKASSKVMHKTNREREAQPLKVHPCLAYPEGWVGGSEG